MSRHSAIRRRWAVIGTVAFAGILAVVDGAASAVVPTCRVVNETTPKHFPPDTGQSLTAAIAAAIAGDDLTVTGTCTGTYRLDKDLTLTGLSTRRFPVPTLDGGKAGTTLTVDPDVTATVTNLTITGGTGQGSILNLDRDGGGIFNRGTLTLVHVNVIGNTATRGSGGGIYNSSSGSVILQGLSIVSGNGAEDGGGIFSAGTAIVRESSILTGNSAEDGGGIESLGTLTLVASSVTGNNAFFRGGGIFNGGTATLQSATVSNNTVTFDGAGIFNGGTLTLSSSTLSGNMGSGAGGGIRNQARATGAGGVLTVNASTLNKNASGNGGGVYNGGGNVTLNSSAVSGNTASVNGGGINNESGTTTLQGASAVTGNTAFVSGGGIYNDAGLVTLDPSIVSGNTPDNCVGVVGC